MDVSDKPIMFVHINKLYKAINVFLLVKGEWRMETNLDTYDNAPYDVYLVPDESAPIGYKWQSDDEQIEAEFNGTLGESPDVAEVSAFYDMFVKSLGKEEEQPEVAFCFII